MLHTLIRRCVLVVALTVPVAAAAQSAQPTEAELLSRIAKTPDQVANYLDLAKLYAALERYDDAQRMLLNAQGLINQKRMHGQSVLFGAASAGAPKQVDRTQPLRVFGGVKEPTKIKDVRPEYPAIAQAARVAGIVIAEIVVDRDGGVRDAKVLRGVPLLDEAALNAIRQWRYLPTMLNGVPVEVVMTVTVNFVLDGPDATSGLAGGAGVSSMGAYAGPAPVRLGGNVREPRKLKDAKPVYPPDALASRVTGIVILEVIIDADGKIAQAKILRSVPMLAQAALAAVTQWEYEPTFVNGVAVPVVMTVTVHFTLSGGEMSEERLPRADAQREE